MNPLPPLTFSTVPAAVCLNTEAAQEVVPTAGVTYSWSVTNGTITQNAGHRVYYIPTASPVTLTVTVTDTNGCSTSDSRTIPVDSVAIPTITASGPTTFCPGGSVTLTAPAGNTYSWSNGATSQSIVVNAAGAYSVTVTNANFCSAKSADTNVTLYANPSAPTINASGPTSFCPGGSVTLTAPSGYAGYLWSTGATSQSIVVTAANQYTVRVTDGNGCTATSAATNVVNYTNPPAPVISQSGSTSFCPGGSVTLTAPAGYSAYLWSNGSTTQSIVATTQNQYTVQVTDMNGCTATSAATNVVVYTNPPTPAITNSGSTTFCQGGSVTLTAPAGYTSYSWSNGSTAQSIVATSSANYSVTVFDSHGCSAVSAPTTVVVNPNPPTPAVSASGSTTFCEGGSVTLTAPAGYTYLWSNGLTAQSIAVTTGANYSVIITNANGCSAQSASTAVTVNPATRITSQPSPATQTVAHNVTATITVGASGTGTLSYQWYQGAAGNTSTPVGTNSNQLKISQTRKATYTYWVRVTAPCGTANSNIATVNVN